MRWIMLLHRGTLSVVGIIAKGADKSAILGLVFDDHATQDGSNRKLPNKSGKSSKD